MSVARLAVIYFGSVFGAGFVFGPLRVLFLEPRVGTRWAELLEMPLMLIVIMLAARWMVRKPAHSLRSGQCLVVGMMALAMTLAAETCVGMWLRHLTLSQIYTQRDPVSGTAYYAMLLIFGLAPWWVASRRGRQ